MLLNVSHQTRYTFDISPAYGLQQLRLTPKSSIGQNVLKWALDIKGAVVQAKYDDEHGNVTHLVSLDKNVTELVILSHGEIDMQDQGGIVGPHSGYAPLWLYGRETELTKAGPEVRSLAENLTKTPEVTDFHNLSKQIAERVQYTVGQTIATTTAEQAIAIGQGVCQDHAHIFIAATRHAGHFARYVSGYLMMNDRIDQDATHAWAEVWIDGLGWTGFDVSNGISPDARYVRLATGLDYAQAAPISGLTVGGGGESINVDVQVQQ